MLLKNKQNRKIMCGKTTTPLCMLAVFFGILLTSCNQNNLKKSTQGVIINNFEENKTENDQSTKLIADLPIKLDSTSNYIVFQVKTLTEKENKISYDSRKRYNDTYLRNLIFQNIQTEQTNVLTVNKISIISYEQLYNAKNETENAILYQVIDTFPEDEDAVILTSLYLSSNDGKHFKKISTKNHHLGSWEYFPELKKVFFKTIEDSDGNNKLNNLDKHHIYSVSIEDFKATELLADELKTIPN